MPATLERRESQWRIRLEGEATLAHATELRDLLLTWSGAGVGLEWDLTEAQEIDIATLQLIWASVGEAARCKLPMKGDASPSAWGAIQNSGLDRLPEFPLRPVGHE